MDVLKVSSKSKPNSVAGALANAFKDKQGIEIQAIGAGALNQAIKAIAIARGFVAPSGKNLICIPAFTDIDINGYLHIRINIMEFLNFDSLVDNEYADSKVISINPITTILFFISSSIYNRKYIIYFS